MRARISTNRFRQSRSEPRSRGQIVVIFAGAMLLFFGLAAAVIDVSWYWTNNLRMQRAADAAALAGAVYLPGNPGRATDMAIKEAMKNGFVAPDYAVVPTQDPGNDRRLNVRVSGDVGTFFARALGIASWPAARTGSAEYVLPVPMGSPENYYGVGVLNLPSEEDFDEDTGWQDAESENGNWNDADEADNDIDENGPASEWARSPVDRFGVSPSDPRQQWYSFGLTSGSNGIPDESSLEIEGIEIRSRAFLQGSGSNTNGCRMIVRLSWNGGNNWSGSQSSGQLPTSGPPITPVGPSIPYNVNLGGPTDTWGVNWDHDELDDSFRVEVTFDNTPSSGCSNTRRLAVDTLEVRVHYTYTDLGPPEPVTVTGPGGQTLIAQRFWGAMQSQGAPAIQGDAYMAGYTTRKNPTNPTYDPHKYYNYGIDIMGTGGQVWLFDPGFCDTSPYQEDDDDPPINQGTGESWTLSGSNTGGNGASSAQPVSTQFNLYHTNDTPYTYDDDTLVASTGSTFRRLHLRDPDLGGNTGGAYGSPGDCRSTSWHNEWWPMPGAQSLSPGKYRLHTTSRIFTDPKAGTLDGTDNQTDATGLNAFAIWTTSDGPVAPRVYGLGAMEAYFPLPGNDTSIFYLAQIDAVHKGKWMDIDLWDPGDTGSLTATLSFLAPGSTTGERFYWNQSIGSAKPASFPCGPQTSSRVQSITTSTGSGGIYNGRWLRICIEIPDEYDAPVDPQSGERGWWKIRYQMSNSGASTDLTTWQVSIRGNPVHLVLD